MFIICATMYASALAHWALLVPASIQGYTALYLSLGNMYTCAAENPQEDGAYDMESSGITPMNTCYSSILLTINVSDDY